MILLLYLEETVFTFPNEYTHIFMSVIHPSNVISSVLSAGLFKVLLIQFRFSCLFQFFAFNHAQLYAVLTGMQNTETTLFRKFGYWNSWGIP